MLSANAALRAGLLQSVAEEARRTADKRGLSETEVITPCMRMPVTHHTSRPLASI